MDTAQSEEEKKQHLTAAFEAHELLIEGERTRLRVMRFTRFI
jgi:hypothetical protein